LPISLLKLAVPTAIIVWLAIDIQRNDPETFSRMQAQPKDWGRLALAASLCFGAFGITFSRWFFLVRALGIPFHVSDAFRLGFCGFLLNFVTLGNVGGDLFKAVLIARQQRTRRLEAVATIAVDRMIGMYGLLVVASLGFLAWAGLGAQREIQIIGYVTLLVTALSTIGILLVLVPGIPRAVVARKLEKVPKIGRGIERLFLAWGMYRRQKGLLVAMGLISLTVHALVAVAVYLAASALYAEVPSIFEHLIICPVATVVGALPISPAGLGTFEVAMRFLYDQVPADGSGQGKGLVVALCWRVVQIIVACAGAAFYWRNRRRAAEAFDEADQTPAA
jgi:hypothetical protein